jgi:hypothetical protein
VIRQSATFVADYAAAGLWSAAECAQVRREQGSDLLLRDSRDCCCKSKIFFTTEDTENTEKKIRKSS